MIAKVRADIGIVHGELCANGTYRALFEGALIAFLTGVFAEFDMPIPTWARIAAGALIARATEELCA